MVRKHPILGKCLYDDFNNAEDQTPVYLLFAVGSVLLAATKAGTVPVTMQAINDAK